MPLPWSDDLCPVAMQKVRQRPRSSVGNRYAWQRLSSRPLVSEGINYDEEIDADSDRANQWRVTRRAILNWRTAHPFLSEDLLEGRLDWLRNPSRCSCPILSASVTPDASWDAAWDERRYHWFELLSYKDMEWSMKRAEELRNHLTQKPNMSGWSTLQTAEWRFENNQRSRRAQHTLRHVLCLSPPAGLPTA